MLKWFHVTDIPASITLRWVGGLAKLTNEDAIVQLMQINIVVLRRSDDELAGLDALVLNDLDSIDECTVGNDEDLLNEVDISRLVI